MKKLNVLLEDGTTAVVTVDGMFVEGMNFDGMDEIRGIKEIRRASDVEFHSDTQHWVAKIRPEFMRDDTVIHSFCAIKRSDCIKWEREYLNARGGE